MGALTHGPHLSAAPASRQRLRGGGGLAAALNAGAVGGLDRLARVPDVSVELPTAVVVLPNHDVLAGIHRVSVGTT